jgi:hypothetical protein
LSYPIHYIQKKRAINIVENQNNNKNLDNFTNTTYNLPVKNLVEVIPKMLKKLSLYPVLSLKRTHAQVTVITLQHIPLLSRTHSFKNINKTPYLTFSIHNSREKLNGDNFSVITFLNQTIYGLNTCILPGIHRY